jgi:hypothetical protein
MLPRLDVRLDCSTSRYLERPGIRESAAVSIPAMRRVLRPVVFAAEGALAWLAAGILIGRYVWKKG